MKRDEILDGLLHLSDRQFDPIAKKQVREIVGLSDEEVRKPLLFLLDDCVYGALCSDFEIMVMNELYRRAGGTKEEMDGLMEEREARLE